MSKSRILVKSVLVVSLLLTSLFLVLGAEKNESPIDKFIRLHNEISSNYKELNILIVSNSSVLDGPNCIDNYGEAKCKEIANSVISAKSQQMSYNSLLEAAMKMKGD